MQWFKYRLIHNNDHCAITLQPWFEQENIETSGIAIRENKDTRARQKWDLSWSCSHLLIESWYPYIGSGQPPLDHTLTEPKPTQIRPRIKAPTETAIPRKESQRSAGSISIVRKGMHICSKQKEANLTNLSSSLKETATMKVLRGWSITNRWQLKPQLQFPSKQKEDKAGIHS
jgi:hypothetical protein